jgi:hypothetical protein
MAKKKPRKPRRRSAPDKRLALTITASMLAASALAGCDASPARGVAGRAPECAPAVTSPREGSWEDPNGCWENRGGQRVYRTVWGGRSYYYSSPPYYSRYYESESGSRGSRWFSGSHSASGGGYHGAPSGAG